MRMETLGNRIKYLRQRNQETQGELAAIAGVTKQAISKIERVGVIESASSTLEPIARHYGVSLRWLLEGGPQDKAQPAPLSVSRSLRLDPEIVRDVAQALQEVFAEHGLVYSITEDPQLFADFYERAVELGSVDSRSNLVWLGTRIGSGEVRQGAERGKSKGLDVESNDPRKVRGKRAKG